MQRGAASLAVVCALSSAVVLAAPQVFGPDDQPLDRAAVVAEAGSYWVRDGVNLPMLLTPDADDNLRLPDLAAAHLLVLDAATGKPVPGGHLRWAVRGIPDTISTVSWSDHGGRLDLGCRGGEPVELVVEGYRPLRVTLQPQNRRRTVLPAADGAPRTAR